MPSCYGPIPFPIPTTPGKDLRIILSSTFLILWSRIQTASRVPLQSVPIHRTLFRDGVFDPALLQAVMNRKTTTAANATRLFERISDAATTGDFGGPFVPCEAVHPWMDSCVLAQVDRFASVFRWMFPIYGALHLVPAVMFKRKTFFKKPWEMLGRAAWGTVRSSAFLGVFVAIYQSELRIDNLFFGDSKLMNVFSVLLRKPQSRDYPSQT